MYLTHIRNCHSLKVKKFGVKLETVPHFRSRPHSGKTKKQKQKQSLFNANLQSRKITTLPPPSPLLKYFLKLVLSQFKFPSNISYNNLICLHVCDYYKDLFSFYQSLDNNNLKSWRKPFKKHIFKLYIMKIFKYIQINWNSKMNLHVSITQPQPLPTFSI